MQSTERKTAEHLDVLIIGAGISGLGMCYTLKKHRQNDSFAVIESRNSIGGTWDFFKYPGLRSDSDMYTFAYSFKPWKEREYIGSADRINNYLRELVEEENLRKHIRFRQRVVNVSWCSKTDRWTCTIRRFDTSEYKVSCKFLVSCTGYYNYENGYLPKFEGHNKFKGDIIHPQKWPENYDYKNKRIVVIGSGATAVTLVPKLADKARHVVMLQRSPTYIYNRPSSDGVYRFLSSFLPAKLTNKIMRAKYVLLQQATYFLSKRFPDFIAKVIRKDTAKALNDDIDVDTHFKPRYKPWDQRVCMVPDGDLFECLNSGSASIVTAHIDAFTEEGVKLKNGRHIDADVIVTATGLEIQLWGGMSVEVDGQKVIPNSLTNYKGMMFSNIPNLLMIFGYTNSSWTLKAELTYQYICRLFNYLEKNHYSSVYPYLEEEQESEGIVDLNSGYILRAAPTVPKQGLHFPWRNKDFYLKDLMAIKYSGIADGVLRFDDTQHLSAFHRQAAEKRYQTNDIGEAS
ncbi:flavin-containing monooxygenase [Alteromonas gracilis]|uniref:flavin-containing monooxygenase n=1 Tax=Alteromonas gracilis TaxID=1479524 RepID=UPI0037367FF2